MVKGETADRRGGNGSSLAAVSDGSIKDSDILYQKVSVDGDAS